MALDASVAIGDLLLQGWTMTADSCSSCKVPLMQNPADQSLLCVSCLETIEEAVSHSVPTRTVTPHTGDERLGPYAQSSDQSSTMMEGMHPEEDVSNMLACKMLQGYTLLSQNCPQCRTPLVQKGRERPAECVSCQTTLPLPTTCPQSSKRISQNRESPQPSAKILKSTEADAISASNANIKDWRLHTETVLVQKIDQLTEVLEEESSKEAITETVSSIQLCLDVLLKLKEFRSS